MKKNVITLLLGAVALTAGAQQYTVSGNAPAGVSKLYLQNLEVRGSAGDSVEVVDGKFTFKGDAAGKIFATVYTAAGEGVPVVLDGDVKVDFATKKATGTTENDGLSRLNAQVKTHQDKMSALAKEFNEYRKKGEVPEDVNQRINKAYDEEMKAMVAVVQKGCEENISAKFPAYFLVSMSPYMERADVIAMAEKKPAFLQVSLTQRLNKTIAGWKLQMPGVMFTDLTMADTTGVEHKLSEYVGKGKYVLIDFWASWCGPCRQEMPHVKALYDKYRDKGFDIVGLSFDNNKQAWIAGIKKLDIPWHHLSDLKGWNCVAGQIYGINSIPATLLVGPDGKVIAGGLRGKDLEDKLAEIFK